MGVLEDLLIVMNHDMKIIEYNQILGCSYTTLKIKKDDWDLKYRRAGHELQFWLLSVRNFQERSSVMTIN